MGNRGDDQCVRIFKADEASIKQMIDAGVSNSPLAPFKRSLLFESRQGLQ
jgi:hypothetical protein